MRTSRLVAIAVAVFLAAALAVRCGWRNHGPTTHLKVIVVGLDGAHLALLSPLLEQGRLPRLRAFLERAAIGVMASPVHEGFTSPALWTTMVTGVEPYRHGITDFVLPEPEACVDVAATSGHRTAPALWNMLTDAGLSSAIVGLWATWPAEPIGGAIVSDHVTYSRMRLSKDFRNAADGAAIPFNYDTGARNVSPPALDADIHDLVRTPGDIEPELLRRFADFTDEEVRHIIAGEYTGGFNQDTDRLQELKVTAQSDRSYAAIGQLLAQRLQPDLLWVYLEGIDVIEHKFWPYHERDFPRPITGNRGQYAEVLNHYVEYTEELIAPYLERADEQTVVMIVSDHGYATVPDPGHPSGHWHDHNAIFFAAGGPIRPGPIGESISLYDVTPTVLALLGLPVADDMPGHALSGIVDPAFLEQHPIGHIASYGTRAAVPGDIGASMDDPLYVQRLKELGYMGAASSATGEPIAIDRWQQTPHVFGRLAIPCDVKRGRAVFVTDPTPDARPGPGPMPRCAIYTDDAGVAHPVIVIQVEQARGRDRIGFRHLDGSPGRADGSRIELLPGPDGRFR